MKTTDRQAGRFITHGEFAVVIRSIESFTRM